MWFEFIIPLILGVVIGVSISILALKYWLVKEENDYWSKFIKQPCLSEYEVLLIGGSISLYNLVDTDAYKNARRNNMLREKFCRAVTEHNIRAMQRTLNEYRSYVYSGSDQKESR